MITLDYIVRIPRLTGSDTPDMPEEVSRFLIFLELTVALYFAVPFLMLLFTLLLNSVMQGNIIAEAAIFISAGCVMLCLGVGLNIACTFLRFGSAGWPGISQRSWIICWAGSVTSLVSGVLWLTDQVNAIFFVAFSFGILFVPVFAHLFLEHTLRQPGIVLQNATSKQHRPT